MRKTRTWFERQKKINLNGIINYKQLLKSKVIFIHGLWFLMTLERKKNSHESSSDLC
jgi:hypothetical protein